MPRGAPPISHLSFADDLILFTRGHRRSLRALFDFIGRYEKASGQLINKDKSFFVASPRCSPLQGRIISSLVGIRRSTLPFRYLGCTLYTGRCKKVYFASLVQSVRNKLDGWQARLLTPGGRLILIRHVLQALPIHTLAAMNPPLGILRELEGLFSKFFWSNSTDNPRKVWRNWNWLSFPIEENGIGVRKLEDVLLAFTCKLWWKISCLTGIWARYIRAISWERSVLRVRLRAAQAVFDSHIAFQVRDGSSSFWDSNWLGSGPLRLHDLLLSPPPDLTIREAFEGDSQDVLSDSLPNDLLQHVLQHRPTFISQPDCIVWKPSPSGAFTISSAYSMARSRRSQHSLVSSFWASNIPLKTSIFLWRLYNIMALCLSQRHSFPWGFLWFLNVPSLL